MHTASRQSETWRYLIALIKFTFFWCKSDLSEVGVATNNSFAIAIPIAKQNIHPLIIRSPPSPPSLSNHGSLHRRPEGTALPVDQFINHSLCLTAVTSSKVIIVIDDMIEVIECLAFGVSWIQRPLGLVALIEGCTRSPE